jgi:cytochrome b involved in lipid metabolism
MYPLCDKTHEIFNKETNSNIQPIVVEFSELKGDLNTRKKKRDLLMDSENKVESTVQQQQETKEAVSPSGKKKETTEIVGEKLLPASPRKEIVFKKIEKKKITAVFTEEEIAKHCTKDDCWMIIKGGVYDITPYFSVHPGGQRALLKFAGKDGTENVQYHSSQMMYLLDNYFYVGKLAGYQESSSCTIS